MNSTNVPIDNGALRVDTDAWLDTVTGGTISELTDLAKEFAKALRAELRPRYTNLSAPEIARLFAIARAGTGWLHADHFPVIDTATNNTDAATKLTEDMVIIRYDDPDHGAVALITRYQDPLSYGEPVAYTDAATDSTAWFGWDRITLSCPAGHTWEHDADELSAADGTTVKTSDLFPDGFVTTDTDRRSPTWGRDIIRCPACGAHCTATLTDS
jgi:hypothetical protein